MKTALNIITAAALLSFFSPEARALTINFSTSVDQTTAIPGGTGNFTTFIFSDLIIPGDPCIGADGAVGFRGSGADGQFGVYVKIPTDPCRLAADLNTAIPSGTGNFTDFGGLFISNDEVSFLGADTIGQFGVYQSKPDGPPIKVADLNTAIPSGTGNFLSFGLLTSIDNGSVAFTGNGGDGQQGVYRILQPEGPPIKVADTNTAIPGGTGNFVSISPAIRLLNDQMAFIGNGGDGQQGVYEVLQPDGPPIKVADTSTTIPGSGQTFAMFNLVAFDGANVAFSGGTGPFVDSPVAGVYKVLTPESPPIKVADTNTDIPSGTGNFLGFGFVAIDPGVVVFEGFGSNGQAGLYTDAGGELSIIIALGDTLEGKTLTDLRFGPGGFSHGQVAFAAAFDDGSQGISVATIEDLVNRCPHTQSYWKNNPTLWPLFSLVLGSQTYSQAELLNLRKTSFRNDASLQLANQLIAAKLNIANNSDPTPVASTIADADSLLAGFSGKLPYKVKPSSATGKLMASDTAVLTDYNNGLLTSGCVP